MSDRDYYEVLGVDKAQAQPILRRLIVVWP